METPQLISERMQGLDRRILAREILLNERKERLENWIKELKDLEREQILLTAVDQTLLAISTKILTQSTKTIDKLVTAGLRITFEDQNLELKTRIEKFRGKTSIFFDLLEDGKTAPIMDSYGGGVLVMVGVLLRVVTIITLKLRRILILDETLSHLSTEYVANASKLLKKLCQELDFDILMITHQEEFASSADHHYQAKRGTEGTTFELVRSSPGSSHENNPLGGRRRDKGNHPSGVLDGDREPSQPTHPSDV